MIFFADLHVHIGRASQGEPVKITASPKLTLQGILAECLKRKGIQIAGIVDAASPPVIRDIQELMAQDKLVNLPGGGLSYLGQVTLFLGAEVELAGPNGGSAHFLAYTASVAAMKELSDFLTKAITNISLSSQRAHLEIAQVHEFVTGELNGIFLPAHAFTPFKSVYGNCVRHLAEIGVEFPALELGLSADTNLADRLPELGGLCFLSNSDAHSLPKIAREYNALELVKPDFTHFRKALEGDSDNRLLANYGLDPRLGKYHRTYCLDCDSVVAAKPPVDHCHRAANHRVVVGVLDRITIIAGAKEPIHPPCRPPYIHQVPLEFIPGVGPKTLGRLLSAFGTEMNIIHGTSLAELAEVVGSQVAESIVAAREGRLGISVGGGGHYGRIQSSR